MATGFIRRDKGKFAFPLNALYQQGQQAQSVLVNAGTPTNGAAGTGYNCVTPGSLLADITNAALYINTGTSASPTWSAQGSAETVTAASSATPASGITTIATTAGGAYTLLAPVAGVVKKIILTATSNSSSGATLNTVTVGTTATITAISTNGSLLTTFSFRGQAGACLLLEGLSTTQWAVLSANTTATITST